ncbi:hypothetical protein [Niabella aurantiaca]|uniref:hypothetical protein n=1 Tax=Niabella aurantiaca TaxID=379900 RepID=UPI0012F852D6|nr:hypothetical protein [Niabella aurantiaca]
MGIAKRKSKTAHSEKIWNKRIFELVAERVSLTREPEKEIFALIGLEASNAHAVRNGKQSFTVDQIVSAARLFGVSLDWIAGIIDTRNTVNIPLSNQLIDIIAKEVKNQISDHFATKNHNSNA